MTDLIHFTKLIEMLLFGAACFYIGHQTAKPKEQRHWTKIKKTFVAKDDKPVPPSDKS